MSLRIEIETSINSMTRTFLMSLSLEELREILRLLGSAARLKKEATVNEILLHRRDGVFLKLYYLKKNGPSILSKTKTLQRYLTDVPEVDPNFNVYQIRPSTPEEWFGRIKAAVDSVVVASAAKNIFIQTSYPDHPSVEARDSQIRLENLPGTSETSHIVNDLQLNDTFLVGTNNILERGFESVVTVITDCTKEYKIEKWLKQFREEYNLLSSSLDRYEKCVGHFREEEFKKSFDSLTVIVIQLSSIMDETEIEIYNAKLKEIETKANLMRTNFNKPSSSRGCENECGLTTKVRGIIEWLDSFDSDIRKMKDGDV